jgi:hypothetical protein
MIRCVPNLCGVVAASLLSSTCTGSFISIGQSPLDACHDDAEAILSGGRRRDAVGAATVRHVAI